MDLLTSKISLLAPPLLEKYNNDQIKSSFLEISENLNNAENCRKSSLSCENIENLNNHSGIMDLLEVFKKIIDENLLFCDEDFLADQKNLLTQIENLVLSKREIGPLEVDTGRRRSVCLWHRKR